LGGRGKEEKKHYSLLIDQREIGKSVVMLEKNPGPFGGGEGGTASLFLMDLSRLRKGKKIFALSARKGKVLAGSRRGRSYWAKGKKAHRKSQKLRFFPEENTRESEEKKYLFLWLSIKKGAEKRSSVIILGETRGLTIKRMDSREKKLLNFRSSQKCEGRGEKETAKKPF